MKRFLAILLALAMVVSCVSMVSLFVGAEGENEWSDNLLDANSSSFEETEIGAKPAGFGELATTISVVESGEPALPFSGQYAWSSPQFADTKSLIVAAVGSEADVDVFYSLDVFIGTLGDDPATLEKTTAGLLVRTTEQENSQNFRRVFDGDKQAVTKQLNEWVTLSGIMTIPASSLQDTALKYDLMLDGLNSDAKYGYVKNPQVCIVDSEGNKGENLWTTGLSGATSFASASLGNITEIGDNHVLKSTTPNSWSSPKFPTVVPAAKAIIDDNGWKQVDIKFSGKVLLSEGGNINIHSRTVGGNNQIAAFGTLTDLPAGEWTEFEFVVTKSASDDTWTAEDPWVLAFDGFNKTGGYALYDDIAIQVRKWIPEAKKVVNGDVELGTTEGWAKLSAAGGSIELVEGGANETNYAIQFNGSGKWDSVGFSIGAAIIDYPDAGYQGAGPGDYTLTFYAKAAETGKGGQFHAFFNSQWHKSKGTVVGEYTTTVDTWNGGEKIDMTDEWQQFEITVTVSEEWYQNLIDAYEAGAPVTIFDIILRLDGSIPDGAFADGGFAYLIDEVTITAPGSEEEGGEEGGEEVKQLPGGVRFKAAAETSQIVLKSAAGFLSSANVKDGQVTVGFPITNMFDTDVKVDFALQTTAQNNGSATWAGPENHYESVTIAPGETEYIEYTMDVENGKVEVYDGEYDLSTFFLRFNVLPDGNTASDGEDFDIIIGANADSFYEQVAGMKNIFGADSVAAETVLTANGVVYDPSAGANAGDVLPIALIAVLAVAVAAVAVIVIKKRKEN